MGIQGYRKWLQKHFPYSFLRVPDAPPPRTSDDGAPRRSVRGLEREFFDHIYLDLNGLVHVLGRRAKDEDHLITMLFRQLDRLLKICVPTRTVFIALDGPASAAKLITQRKRRLESVRKQQRKMDREKEEETGNGASTGVAAASSSGGASALGSGSVYDGGQGSQIGNTTMAGEEGVFDFSRLVSVIYGEEHLAQYKQQQAQQQQPQQGQATPQPNEFSSNGGAATGAKQQKKKKKRPAGEFNLLQVTAGCPFMHRLKQSICYWACTRLQSDRKYSNVRIFVSGADVSGEGEVKIMEHIVGHANQSGRTTGSGGIGNGDEIWGVSEIAEFREQSHLIVGSDADLILLGLATMLPNVFVLTTDGNDQIMFSISSFCSSLESITPFRGYGNLVRLDFIILSLLQGNDYVPKLRGASMDMVWARYKRLKQNPQYRDQFLVNPDLTINVPVFLALISSFPVVRTRFPFRQTAARQLPQPAQLARTQSQTNGSDRKNFLAQKPSEAVQQTNGAAQGVAMVPNVDITALAAVVGDALAAKLASSATATSASGPASSQPTSSASASGGDGDDDDIEGEQIMWKPFTPFGSRSTPVLPSTTSVAAMSSTGTARTAPIGGIQIAVDDEEEEDGEEGEEEDEEEDDIEDDEEEEDEDEEVLQGLIVGSDPRAYIEGLQWCLRMYVSGCCPDNSWFYPYRYAPTAAQIMQAFPSLCQSYDTTSVLSLALGYPAATAAVIPLASTGTSSSSGMALAEEIKVSVPTSTTPPLHPYIFAMTVLPLEARSFVHEKLQHLIDTTSASELAFLYTQPALLIDTKKVGAIVANALPITSMTPEERRSGLCLGDVLVYKSTKSATFHRGQQQQGRGRARSLQHSGSGLRSVSKNPPDCFPPPPCERFEPLHDPELTLKCRVLPSPHQISDAPSGHLSPHLLQLAWPEPRASTATSSMHPYQQQLQPHQQLEGLQQPHEQQQFQQHQQAQTQPRTPVMKPFALLNSQLYQQQQAAMHQRGRGSSGRGGYRGRGGRRGNSGRGYIARGAQVPGQGQGQGQVQVQQPYGRSREIRSTNAGP